jgi:hypothetical protein
MLHGRLSLMLGAGENPDAVVAETIILRDDHPTSRGQGPQPARYPISSVGFADTFSRKGRRRVAFD